MTDERHGLPSASKMERVANCPPSHKLERLCEPGETNEAAETGRRIHAALAGELDFDALTIAEQETAEMCQQQANALVDEWLAGRSSDEMRVIREQRLWLHKGSLVMTKPHGAAKFSGQADLICVVDDTAIVIDYKTGRGEQTDAVDNAQLASLAVLVANYCDVNQIRVAIVQPWAGKPTVCDYSEAELLAAESWLQNRLDAERNSIPAQARVGKWCKWCRAAAQNACAAFRNENLQIVEKLTTQTMSELKPVEQSEQLFTAAMHLPAAELAQMMAKLSLVEKAVKAIKEAAKSRAQSDAQFQEFYSLRQKAGRRSIMDVGTTFQRVAAYGVSADDFTAQCSITISAVRELLGKVTQAKGNELDALTEFAIEGLVAQSEPTTELRPLK